VQELRIARSKAGMTLMELEAASGVGASTISKIERGVSQPQAITLHKLAEALGVEIADLLPKTQAPPPLDGPVGGASPSTSAINLAVWAAKRQDTANWQTIARAKESDQQQLSTVAHENEAFLQLRKYPPGDLAEALQDLAQHYLWREQENEQEIAELRKEIARLRDQLQEREQAHS
jgi:transcriptional regulator with XRE-family HTH domain